MGIWVMLSTYVKKCLLLTIQFFQIIVDIATTSTASLQPNQAKPSSFFKPSCGVRNNALFGNKH